MTKTASVGVSGANKNVNAMFVGVSGAWKTVSAAYVGVGGVWKQFFAVSGGGGGSDPLIAEYIYNGGFTVGVAASGGTEPLDYFWEVTDGRGTLVSGQGTASATFALNDPLNFYMTIMATVIGADAEEVALEPIAIGTV